MGKIIAMFNHKGGVGKTTLVHNVGSALAQRGKAVLFIDADPQMNLTASFYGKSDSIEYTVGSGKEVETTVSQWERCIAEGTSIREILYQAMKGTAIPRQQCSFQDKAEGEGKVALMAGDVALASLEMDVALAIASRRDLQGEHVIQAMEYLRSFSQQYDLILIDTPPSASSALTALLVRISDYLITPASPTFFSLQAIDNLRPIFENWNREFSWLSGLKDPMQFLGVVVQMAKRYAGGTNTSDFSKATESWIETLNERVQPFQQWMLSIGKSITQETFTEWFPNSQPFVIEKCCDFTPQLRGIAERAGVPVINLTQDLCNQYAPQGTNVDITKENGQYTLSLQKIRVQYKNIAANIERLLNAQ